MEIDIIIRKAKYADAKEIWRLLHSENIGWGDEQILSQLDRFFLLTYGNKLLGLAHGSLEQGHESISFTVIHPMYPEGSLRTALVHSLLGIICRRPHCDIEQLQGEKNTRLPEHGLQLDHGNRDLSTLMKRRADQDDQCCTQHA